MREMTIFLFQTFKDFLKTLEDFGRRERKNRFLKPFLDLKDRLLNSLEIHKTLRILSVTIKTGKLRFSCGEAMGKAMKKLFRNYDSILDYSNYR